MVKSRRMGWASNVAPVDNMRNKYRILVEKPEGKRVWKN
jgi:hypothetical protein